MAQPEYPFPLAEYLEMVTEEVEPGRVRACLTAGEKHRHDQGLVHGAVLFALVDTAMGRATLSLLGDDARCATIELQLRFLRPMVKGSLVAEARVLRPGRRVVQLHAEVTDAEGRLVATAGGSFAVLSEGSPAPG